MLSYILHLVITPKPIHATATGKPKKLMHRFRYSVALIH